MAKSLRSKRMRRNRAHRALKTGPRVLKRMVDSLEKAKVLNDAREAEKLKETGVEMQDVTEQPEKALDAEMVDPKKKLDTFTGLNIDGSKPVWMNQRQFKRLTQAKKSAGKKTRKFGLVTEGLGPRQKFLADKKKSWKRGNR